MNLWPHTIVVLRAGTGSTDDWGNPVDGWDDPTETTVTDCSVQPEKAPEFIIGEQRVEDLLNVWRREPFDVLATDRIEYDGETYDVAGEIKRWDFPPLDHVEFKMRRIEAE